MSTMITYKLFDGPDPIKQIMPSVNKVLLDDILITRVNTGMFRRSFVVDYQGKQAGAGGLITFKDLPLPIFNGAILPYMKLQFKAYMSSWNKANVMRFENDLKCVFTAAPNANTDIQNDNNGSTQFKPIIDPKTGAITGWDFQIDQAGGGWISSGLTVPDLPADALIPYETTMKITDQPGGPFSMLGFGVAGVKQLVPVAHQGNPLQSSNWTKGLAAQFQIEIINPGTTQIVYQDPEICCSDVAFV